MSNPTQEHPRYALYFAYGTITLYREAFQLSLAIKSFSYWSPTTPAYSRFGLVPVRSPLLRESLLISFPQVLRCFSSLCILYTAYVFSCECINMNLYRFPHSEIPESMLVNSSSRLIAVSHVLHRNSKSRHPLYALLPFLRFLSLDKHLSFFK